MNLPGVTVEVTQIAALLKKRVCNGAVLHDTRGDTAVAFSFSLAKVSLQKKTISRIALFLKKKEKLFLQRPSASTFVCKPTMASCTCHRCEPSGEGPWS